MENINNTQKNFKTTPDTNNDKGVPYANINGFNIMQFENTNGHSYFLCIPNDYVDTYQLFVGFPKKDLRYAPKREIVEEINEIAKMLAAINKNNTYLLPNIPVAELEDAAKENDNKKFSRILNTQVQPMLYEANRVLRSYDTAERTVNQVINFVKQTESDTKFIQWLEINLPNFIHGVTYDELRKYYYDMVAIDNKPDTIHEKEEVFDDSTKANNNPLELQKADVKKRLLTPNDNTNINSSGFLNIILTLGVISTIALIGFVIKLFIIK